MATGPVSPDEDDSDSKYGDIAVCVCDSSTTREGSTR
jgi:hypothetical protein